MSVFSGDSSFNDNPILAYISICSATKCIVQDWFIAEETALNQHWSGINVRRVIRVVDIMMCHKISAIFCCVHNSCLIYLCGIGRGNNICSFPSHYPANTKDCPNAGLKSAQPLRRWPIINQHSANSYPVMITRWGIWSVSNCPEWIIVVRWLCCTLIDFLSIHFITR